MASLGFVALRACCRAGQSEGFSLMPNAAVVALASASSTQPLATRIWEFKATSSEEKASWLQKMRGTYSTGTLAPYYKLETTSASTLRGMNRPRESSASARFQAFDAGLQARGGGRGDSAR